MFVPFNPLQWINDKFAEFRALPEKWDRLYSRAQAVFQAEAQKRMDGPVATRFVQTQREKDALIIMRDLDQMQREHFAVLNRLQISDQQPLSGPVVVAVLGVAAAAVAISIISLFRRSTAAERAVEHLIATGATPEEILRALKATAEERAQGIDAVVGQIGGIIKLGLLAAIALAIIPQFARRG